MTAINNDDDVCELMHEYEIDEDLADRMQRLIDLGMDDDEALELAGKL